MNCSQCGAEVVEGATVCPSCGAAQGVAAVAAEPTAAATAPSAPAMASASTGPAPAAARPAVQLTFDVKRLSQTDRIVGVATLVLFISLFLPWFGVNFGFGSVTVDGLWHGYEYIPLLISIAVILYLVARALLAEMPKLPVAHEQILTVAAAVSFVLVLIGFLLKPGGSAVGWRYGAFVSLIAAIVAVAPKLPMALRARMVKRS